MNLAACQGQWSQGANGEAICSGTLQIVVGGGPFGLPPITYAEANQLLVAIGVLWGAVFAFRQLRRLF